MNTQEFRTKMNPRSIDGTAGRYTVSAVAIAIQIAIVIWLLISGVASVVDF